jgi:hypothetical protein
MDLTKLLKLKELYDYDTRNEYFLLPLMSEILNQSQPNCEFLTEQGFNLLLNNILEDIQVIDKIENQEDIKTEENQQRVTRLCLYFCVLYNITLLYSSYCYTLTTDEGKNLLERFDTELINYFFEIDKRSETINKVSYHKLEDYIPHLTEDYLKIFNQEKKKCFTKDIFSTEEELAEQNKPIHIAIHSDDVPEGFDINSAMRVSSV